MFTTLEATSLIARRHQGLAFFGPFNGCGTAGRQGTEATSDAELVAKTEFTSKLVPFVFHVRQLRVNISATSDECVCLSLLALPPSCFVSSPSPSSPRTPTRRPGG